MNKESIYVCSRIAVFIDSDMRRKKKSWLVGVYLLLKYLEIKCFSNSPRYVSVID